MGFFTVQPEWKNQTAVIFASGPSVSKADIDLIRFARLSDKCKVIAINAMYQRVEYADILYFCDFKFYKWHAIDKPDETFLNYPAPKYTITDKGDLIPASIKRLRRGSPYGLSRARDTLNLGSNSGYQCLNLAYLFGCKRIIMVGYDMKPDAEGRTHCHEPHQIQTPKDVYENIIKEGFFDSIAKDLKNEGIEVINTSMDSALHCFEKRPLCDIVF